MRTTTKINWGNKDPFQSRTRVMDTLKTFKGAKRPPDNLGFPERESKTQIDAFYTPHKGGEKR